MDNLSTAFKETKSHSHDLSEEDSRHHMAKTHPRHRSFNSGFSSQHLYHLDAITASLGQSCWLHERSPPAEETALRWTVSEQALPRKAVKISIKSFGIAPNCLEYLAQNRRVAWSCQTGAKVCETRRNAATELHRKLRKGTAISATAATIPCFHCPRLPRTDLSH